MQCFSRPELGEPTAAPRESASPPFDKLVFGSFLMFPGPGFRAAKPAIWAAASKRWRLLARIFQSLYFHTHDEEHFAKAEDASRRLDSELWRISERLKAEDAAKEKEKEGKEPKSS